MEVLQERSGLLGHLGVDSSSNLGAAIIAPIRLAGGPANQPIVNGDAGSSNNRFMINNSTFNTYNYIQPDPALLTSPGRDIGLGTLYTKESESFSLPKRSNIIYETQLMCKGRGFPLWIPQPNMRLPPSHRAKGVSIGDVGIITEYGAFDFLFNICIPPDDPINPPDLPKGFTTLILKPWDVREFRDFPNGSYLASPSIGKIVKGKNRRETTFESSANESALLAMPEGAYHEEVNDLSKFREYAERHVESWYDFALNQRGRKDTSNGDIRLVVGVDKSTSWGIASFSDPFKLRLRETEDVNAKTEPPYTWDHTGMSGEVKAGPDGCDNEDICPTAGGKIRNQTLFVRTLNILLGKDTWATIHKPKDVFDQEDIISPFVDASIDRVPVSSGSLDMLPAEVPKCPISPTIDDVSSHPKSTLPSVTHFDDAHSGIWGQQSNSSATSSTSHLSMRTQRINPTYIEEEKRIKYTRIYDEVDDGRTKSSIKRPRIDDEGDKSDRRTNQVLRARSVSASNYVPWDSEAQPLPLASANRAPSQRLTNPFVYAKGGARPAYHALKASTASSSHLLGYGFDSWGQNSNERVGPSSLSEGIGTAQSAEASRPNVQKPHRLEEGPKKDDNETTKEDPKEDPKENVGSMGQYPSPAKAQYPISYTYSLPPSKVKEPFSRWGYAPTVFDAWTDLNVVPRPSLVMDDTAAMKNPVSVGMEAPSFEPNVLSPSIHGELTSERRPIDGTRLGPRQEMRNGGRRYLYALTNSRDASVAHPSLTINSWMLGVGGLPSSVKMTITHDSAWYGLLLEGSLKGAYRIRSSQPHQFEAEEIDILQSLYDTCVSPDRTAIYLEPKERYSDEYPVGDIAHMERTLADGRRNIENCFHRGTGFFDARHRQAQIQRIKAQITASTTRATSSTSFSSLKPLNYHPGRYLILDVLLQIINREMTLSEARDANSVSELRRTLRTVCDDDTQAPAVLRRLANALLNRAREFSDKDNVEEAIFYYRYLEPITPRDSYHYLEMVLGLTTAHYFRHQLLHMREDLDSMVKYLDIQSSLYYMTMLKSFRNRVVSVDDLN